jgi:hypothetical protein
MRRTRVDAAGLAAYWIDRIERLLRACVRDRDRLPAAQSIDVPFHQLMADELGLVARIYERAGLTLTPAARAELARYVADHPRGKHGKVVYDLRGDFGIEPAAVRKRFGFYFERFAVRQEEQA